MGQGAMSSLTPLAGYSWFLIQQIKQYSRYQKINKLEIQAIIAGFIVVLLSDSFILVGTMLGITISVLYNYRNDLDLILKIKKAKKILLILACLSLITFFALFFYTDLYERYFAYLIVGQIHGALLNYFPRLEDCGTTLLVGKLTKPYNICEAREVHSLHWIIKYGLLTQIGWIFFSLYPIYLFLKKCFYRFSYLEILTFSIVMTLASYFMKIKLWDIANFIFILIFLILIKKYSNKIFQCIPSPKYFFPILAFIIPAIHYSGAELWGNNYVFFLFITLFYLDQNPEFITPKP
jgi:hypothetical protein